jgi:hypothetical protein
MRIPADLGNSLEAKENDPQEDGGTGPGSEGVEEGMASHNPVPQQRDGRLVPRDDGIEEDLPGNLAGLQEVRDFDEDKPDQP